MRIHPKFWVYFALTLASVWAYGVNAGEIERLYGMIDQFRASGQRCTGEILSPVRHLERNPAMEQAAVIRGEGKPLADAMAQVDYLAFAAKVLVVGGNSADVWFKRISERHCLELMASDVTAMGAAFARQRLFLVLAAGQEADADNGAQPRQDSRVDARDLIRWVNSSRGEGRLCGGKPFDVAPPLSWNEILATAAREHGLDMARRGYFSHNAPEGGGIEVRAKQAGYSWRAVGENIAAAPGNPYMVVALWLESAGHCANIMNSAFTEMGGAFVGNNGLSGGFWVLMFASPR